MKEENVSFGDNNQTIFCEECGANNSIKSEYCEECGALLNFEQEVSSGSSGSSIDREIIICQNCETKNKATRQYCKNVECEQSLHRLPASSKNPSKSHAKLLKQKDPKLVWDTSNDAMLGLLAFLLLWSFLSFVLLEFFSLWFLFSVFEGFIITSLLFVVWRSKLASESRNWPTTEGTITSSFIFVSSTSKRGNSASSAHTYFKYTINDVDYGSEDIEYPLCGGLFRDNGDTQLDLYSSKRKRVDKYPAGTKVDVFYNPKKPEKSVLEPGPANSFASSSALLSILSFLFLYWETIIAFTYDNGLNNPLAVFPFLIIWALLAQFLRRTVFALL